MKSGTGEDPFADDTDADDDAPPADQPDADTTPMSQNATQDTTEKPDLPYKFRRETVREDRSQIPFFFRDWVADQEREFIEQLEAELGEDVPKADAREAAMIFAQRNPDEVADVLREFGFDY